jgi:hypothetical protein
MKKLTDKEKYLNKEKTKINTTLLDVDDVHINFDDYPDFCDSFIISAIWHDGTELVDEEMEHLNDDSQFVYEIIESRAY